MKVQLVKGNTKATFGEGDNTFDYWYRPITVEEKQNIISHLEWKQDKGGLILDFKHTDMIELVKLAIVKIENLDGINEDGSTYPIDSIDKLLEATIDPETLNGVIISMWTNIFASINISENLKKKQ